MYSYTEFLENSTNGVNRRQWVADGYGLNTRLFFSLRKEGKM